MTVTRTIIAALAATTLAAPSAFARPIDTPLNLAQPAVAQDLRSPDTRDAATRPATTGAEHLRHLQAGGTDAQRPLPVPPTWPGHPQVISAPLTPVVQRDHGVDATTIGLGIAGSVLAVGAIAGIANRTRRPQRRRVAA